MPAEPGPYLSDSSAQEHPLQNAVTRMGRAVENEIVILDKRSSREHAVQLRDGDQVRVGDVAFVFHDPEMTSVETPFPELDVNREAGEIRVDRRLVQLSSKEFALLAYLYENRGRSVPRMRSGRRYGANTSRVFSITRSRTWCAGCVPRSKTTPTPRSCWSPCAGWGISWWDELLFCDSERP